MNTERFLEPEIPESEIIESKNPLDNILMWLVTIIVKPKDGKDYLPRKYMYKKDALRVKREIEKRGGKVRINDTGCS